jgi:hypothetical protein
MYEIRTQDDGTMVLHRERQAGQFGFDGEIGPLSPHMTTQVKAWRGLVEEDLAMDFDERVDVRFSAREHAPVLVMQARPLGADGVGLSTRDVSLIFPTGPIYGNVDPAKVIDEHGDAAEWARQAIGVERLETAFLGYWLAAGTEALEAFRDELVRRCTEGSQHACELLDAAGVEPPIIEADPDPIAGDETSTRWRVLRVVGFGRREWIATVDAPDEESARVAGGAIAGVGVGFVVERVADLTDEESVALLDLLGRYFEAYRDESAQTMYVVELAGDLNESLPRGMEPKGALEALGFRVQG